MNHSGIKNYINRSDFFLLPLTLVPIDLFKNRFGVFARCELDKSYNNFNNRIYVIYNKNVEVNLDVLESPNYLKTIIIDETYLIYVYKISLHFLLDYKLFLKGSYSLFSNNFKQLLVWTYNITPEREIYNVLYPTKIKLIQKSKKIGIKEILIEYSSKPDLTMETFTVSKLYGIK